MANIGLLTQEAYTTQGINHLNEVVQSIPRSSSDDIYLLFEQDITIKPGLFGFGNSVNLHPRHYASQTNIKLLVELAEAMHNARSNSDREHFKTVGLSGLFPYARGVQLDQAYVHNSFNEQLEAATRYAHPQLFTHEKRIAPEECILHKGNAPEIKYLWNKQNEPNKKVA